MKALYINGKFVRVERTKTLPEKVITSEWIDVIEDEEPTPAVDQVVVRDEVRIDGKHRKRKLLRDKTPSELSREANEEKRSVDRGIVKALYLNLKNGTATNIQAQKALAYIIKNVV